jgi:hypothetical protein
MEAHNGGGGCERECDPQPRRRRAKILKLQKQRAATFGSWRNLTAW